MLDTFTFAQYLPTRCNTLISFVLSLNWPLDLNWSQIYYGHEHFPNWLVCMTKSGDWCEVRSSRVAFFHPKYPLFEQKCFTLYLCCHLYSWWERFMTPGAKIGFRNRHCRFLESGTSIIVNINMLLQHIPFLSIVNIEHKTWSRTINDTHV